MIQPLLFLVIVSFFIGILLGPILIPILVKLKFGQSIREIGPKWHETKAGTPTMGGLIFIISILITTIILNGNKEAYIILLISLGFGIIGFIDDFIKVALKRNLGLSALQKFSAQLAIAVIGVIYLYETGYINNEVYITIFNTSLVMDKILFMVFAVFVILGTVNSVNLTDGLDGLAGGITLIVSIFLTFTAISFNDINNAYFMASVTGSCLAFLIYNSYPAKVFMGDTGSLFLGGTIAVSAIILKIPFMIVIVGAVFVVETLSVIIQVIFFKATGKRVFKMSPLHHHFEMSGWKETKIVTVAMIITVILCIIGFLSINRVLPYI